MKRFIIVTHGHMAEGIRSSIELIMGKQDNLSVYSAYIEGEPYFKPLVFKELEDNPKDIFIVMTDLLGGSVNNELLELTTKQNVHLITGTNLMLAISILMNIPDSDEINNDIRECVEDAKSGIVYCNDIILDYELDEL